MIDKDTVNAIDGALDGRSLEWAARWIQDSLKGETNERVVEFGNNMAMTLRSAALPDTRAPVVRDLKVDWDSYGGRPIYLRAFDIALRLAPVLTDWQVVPRSDGNIQFERGDDEIVIDVSGSEAPLCHPAREGIKSNVKQRIKRTDSIMS